MGEGLSQGPSPAWTSGVDAADPQTVVSCADGQTLFGIDVSVYQGQIDWAAVANDGVEFALVRVSHSLLNEDTRFAENWQGARAAGIATGVYQYFEPDEDPIAQANLLLDRMGPLAPGDLPPVIDVESSGGLPPAAVEAAVGAWLDHVEDALGVKPIVYTGRFFWQDQVGNSAAYADHPLWLAHYTNQCPNIPSAWERWSFHQYCDCGSVAGIVGNVDVNNFNGALEDLLALTGGVCGDGTCSPGEDPGTCAQDCVPCGVIAASGTTIDNGHACMRLLGNDVYWRDEAFGYGEDLVWTQTTASSVAYNSAVWELFFELGGRYELEVYIQQPFGRSVQAPYLVTHAGDLEGEWIELDQTQHNGWAQLGVFDFAAGQVYSVRLDDNTGEPGTDEVQLVVDAVRVSRVDDSGGSSEGSSGEGTSSGMSGTGGGSSGATMTEVGSNTDSGTGSAALPASSEADAGCGCTTRGGVGSWWLAGGLLLIGWRRRTHGSGRIRTGPIRFTRL